MDSYRKYWALLADWADDEDFGDVKRPIIVTWAALVVSLVLGAILCLVDLGYFPFMERIKIQNNKKVPVDKQRLKYAIWIYLRNLLGVSSITGIFLFKLADWRGISYSREVPPLSEFVKTLPLIVLIEDLWFFSCHRLFHANKYLYEIIHKFHHQWNAPIGISVLYMHWIEYTLCIACNVAVGPLVTGCHASIFHFYLTIESFKGLLNHSGYGISWFEIPCVLGNEFHDTHHKLLNCNYGSYGYFDAIFGSFRSDRKSKAA